jgi:hypothetical protein
MRIVPARSGWVWLLKGLALFRKSPAMWLLLVFSFWMTVALLGQIPYLGPLVSTVLLPAFTVSFMAMCAALERGEALRPAHLLSGFRGHPETLLLLGALYLMSIGAVLAVASLADGGALLQSVFTGNNPPTEAVLDGSVSRALLLTVVASAPVMMAFWFAPILAAWNGMGAVKALFYSFFAGWRNWRAFLVYSAALGLISIAFLMLFAAVVITTGGKVETLDVLVLVFMFVFLPTLFASIYVSYRDIFPENRVPEDLG